MRAPRILAITPPTGVDELDAASLLESWRAAALLEHMAVLLRPADPRAPTGPLGLHRPLLKLGRACMDAGLPCFVALTPGSDPVEAASLSLGAAKLGLTGVHLKSGWGPELVAAWVQATREFDIALALSGHQGDPNIAAELDEALCYRSFAPVFDPRTPSEHAKTATGLPALAAYAGTCGSPVLALGGLRPDRVGPCLAHGAYGVASIRALFGAEDELNEYGQALHRALASRVSKAPQLS